MQPIVQQPRQQQQQQRGEGRRRNQQPAAAAAPAPAPGPAPLRLSEGEGSEGVKYLKNVKSYPIPEPLAYLTFNSLAFSHCQISEFLTQPTSVLPNFSWPNLLLDPSS